MKELFQHWLIIKEEKSMPARRDFQPSDVPHLLPHIVLLDVEYNPRRYRSRLVGTETVKAVGWDTTGHYLDDRSRMAESIRRHDWLVENKKPYLYSGALNWSEKSFLNYTAMGLPFAENGDQVDIIMYGMFYTFPETDS
ncbi:PAS domain-containing protein [Emcibacter sp.]|uniref:PAS domain-containing protein n=1 Tax=Emcibacter sp. TaxID=1979954 RepID=UPI002AA91B08|nr:PAS domain-containing protein [Emcibacter sp.]